MIKEIIFLFGNEHIEVSLNEVREVYFRDNSTGGNYSKIDGLKLSRLGVEKEFPDLIGDDDWKQKAIDRFKKKIKEFETDDEAISYLIEELENCGYKAKYINQKGFRPVPIK